MKKINRWISLFLAGAFLCSAFPAVGAAEVTPFDANPLVECDDQETYTPVIVKEDISRRTKNSKDYLLSDGTHTVLVYDYAIHSEIDGEWIDIDNTLSLDTENGVYTTQNGNMGFSFSQNAGEELVSIQNGDYRLSFALSQPNADVSAAPELTAEKAEEKRSVRTAQGSEQVQGLAIEELEAPPCINSVVYEDAAPGTDIEYRLIGDRLQENLVIAQPGGAYEYEFVVSAPGLTAQAEEDGSIIFCAQEETVFTIPAPFMYDASGAVSEAVQYNLQREGTGYRLTLTAQASWINDPSRSFPVVIDPDVTIGAADSSILTVAAKNGEKFYNVIQAGVKSGVEYRTYIKLNTLPVLPAGSVITGAQMALYQYVAGQGFSGAQDFAITMAIKKVTGSWDSETSSFTGVSLEDRIIDYALTEFDPSARRVAFDITPAVIDWYDAADYLSAQKPANYGLCLYRADPATGDAVSNFYGGSRPSYITEPFFTITYRDQRGLSNLYSYQTLSIGASDTAAVNDFAGNMVYEHTDYASTADIMGFKVSHVYNSLYAYYGFNNVNTLCANGLYRMRIHTGNYSSMYVGRGWKLNVYESLFLDSASGYLIYNDATGMEYYLKNTSSGTYIDEDGLGITVTASGQYHIMRYEDGSGQVKRFYNGMLYRIEDEDGNYININYQTSNHLPDNAAPITSVEQYSKEANQTKTIAEFTFGSDHYLTSVKDQYGVITTYTYTAMSNGGRYLTRISSSNGEAVSFQYDTSHSAAMVQAWDELSTYGINFTYENRKVSGYTEFVGVPGLDMTAGSRVRVSRSQNRTVSYAFDALNENGVYENKTYTTYVFDYNGQTITTYATDGGDFDANASGQVTLYGAAAYRYHQPTADRSGRLLQNYAVTGVPSHNLLTNSGAEDGLTGWLHSTSGTDTISAGIAQPRTGDHAFCIENESAGTDKLYRTLSLEAGQTYTFSGYVKTASPFAAGGASLTLNNLQSEVIADSFGEWERISITAKMPEASSGLVSVTLSAQVSGGAGKVYFDDLMIEKGEAPGVYNLLENSDFEVAQTLEGAKAYAAISSGGLNGTRALRLSSDPMSEAYATLSSGFVNYPNGQTFVVSGWAKAASVPMNGEASFGIEVYIAYADGTSEQQTVSFNSQTTAWQYTNATIIPQKNLNIWYLQIRCVYSHNNGYAYFDDLCLTKSDVSQMSYNEKGNLIGLTDENGSLTITRNSEEQVTRVQDSQGGDIEIAPDDDLTQDNTNGVKSQQQTEGNTVTSTTASLAVPSLQQASVVIYTDATLTKAESTTDVNGVTTSYTYDENDRVKTVSTAGTTVHYRYEPGGRAKMTYIPGVAAISYSYQQGALTEIARGGYAPTASVGTEGYFVDYSYDERVYDDNGFTVYAHRGSDGYLYMRFENEALKSSETRYLDWYFDNGGVPYRMYARWEYETQSNYELWYGRDDTGTALSYADAKYTVNVREGYAEFKIDPAVIGGIAANGGFYLNRAYVWSPTWSILDSCHFSTQVALPAVPAAAQPGAAAPTDAEVVQQGYFTDYTAEDCVYADNGFTVYSQWDEAYLYMRFENEALKSTKTRYLDWYFDNDGVPYRMYARWEYETGSNYEIWYGRDDTLQPLPLGSTKYDVNVRKGYAEFKVDAAVVGELAARGRFYLNRCYVWSPTWSILDSCMFDKVVTRPTQSEKQIQNYTYSYDSFGQPTEVKTGTDEGERSLIACTYARSGGALTRTTYGNGQTVDYTYDSLDRVSAVSINGTAAYAYTYDNNGTLVKAKDLQEQTEYTYYYDESGALDKSIVTSAGHTLKGWSKTDEEQNRTTETLLQIDGETLKYSYQYCDEDAEYTEKDNPSLLRRLTLPIGASLLYGYDGLNRRPYSKIYGTDGSLILSTAVQYEANGSYTTNRISEYQTGSGSQGWRVYQYTYDSAGNIATISQGSEQTQIQRHAYRYDKQNQLVMDINYDMNCTMVYVYDTYGNIRSKSELPGTGYASYQQALSAAGAENTDIYSYGSDTWLDLLTAYNGSPITYDAIGNPLTYYNGMSFTWGDGRQLSTLSKVDGTQIQYRYDMNGIRTHKTVGGVTTEYIVNGSMILREIKGNTTYSYYYDEAGAPVAMQSGSTIYYFEKNAQGDIVSLRDATGIEVAHLIYDAYGNTVSIDNPQNLHIPFRYRGYYYDADTGFYYLQSRYYDPETGRFINADDVNYLGYSTFGNLFAYCGNNPVMYVDFSGYSYITKQVAGYKIDGIEMQNIPYASSNVAEAGCGAIAIYNLINSVDETASFQIVLNSLKRLGISERDGGTPQPITEKYVLTMFRDVYMYDSDTTKWGKGVKGKVDGVLVTFVYPDGGSHIFAGISIGFDVKTWYNSFVFYNTGFKEVSYINAYTIPQLLAKMKAISAKPTFLVVAKGYRGNQYIIVDL